MGKPLLYHIIARALRLRCTKTVYLATTENSIDDPLVELALEMGLKVVRGPEDNVMQRFFLAIEASQADYIVRICGDAPLFDPGFIDQSTALIVEHDADCIQPNPDGPSAFQGAGTISRRALEWSRRAAPNDPRTYEHVTAYVYDHLEQLATVTFNIPPDFMGNYKLSIDTRSDLQFFRELYSRLYEDEKIIPLKNALPFIELTE